MSIIEIFHSIWQLGCACMIAAFGKLEDEFQPGYYRCRFIRYGRFTVPGRIERVEDPICIRMSVETGETVLWERMKADEAD